MSDPLSIGDIVRLKSGSPDLTVTGHCEDEHIQVTWFVEDHGYDEVYPAAALTLSRQPASVHELKRG